MTIEILKTFYENSPAIKSENKLRESTHSTLDCSDFDLDFEVSELKTLPPTIDLPTSKSLCTPFCGKTGTGNSFCCTCR